MRVRVIATMIAMSLAAAPVYAQSLQPLTSHSGAQSSEPLSEAVQRAAARLAGQISQSNTTADENPYFLPGILTLSAGGLVTLYGLIHESGVDCSSSVSTVSCSTTHSAGVIVAGLALTGAGGFLLYRGSQHKHSPEIVVGAGRVLVRHHVSWK